MKLHTEVLVCDLTANCASETPADING